MCTLSKSLGGAGIRPMIILGPLVCDSSLISYFFLQPGRRGHLKKVSCPRCWCHGYRASGLINAKTHYLRTPIQKSGLWTRNLGIWTWLKVSATLPIPFRLRKCNYGHQWRASRVAWANRTENFTSPVGGSRSSQSVWPSAIGFFSFQEQLVHCAVRHETWR